MKTSLILLASTLLFIGCSGSAKEKDKEKENPPIKEFSDTTKFLKFSSNFDRVSLPKSFEPNNLDITGKKEIEKEYIQSYICDYENFCLQSDTYNENVYYYYCSLENKFDFPILVYYRIESLYDRQLILAVYSEKEGRLISKMVIWGWKVNQYDLTSEITASLEVKTKTIYYSNNSETVSNKKDSFPIYEKLEKYHLNEEGHFTLDSTKMEKFMAKYENHELKYPITN